MLRRVNRDHALAVVCDETGAVVEILNDAKKFFGEGENFPDIGSMMPDGFRTAYNKFIGEVLEQGHSMRSEIILLKDGREFAFSLIGIARHGRIFLLAVQSPQQIFLIYDEFMAMINEQARELREVQKKTTQCTRERLSAADPELLKDYMKLNNELANMQRELSIKNQALQSQEKRFRDLVTFNPDAQILLSASGQILFFNPAAEKILGLSTTESIGAVFPLDLSHEKEFCLRSEQGRICVEIRQTSVTWENAPATLVSLRDITERKQMEQIKDDVGRILQHDLISPLNPIISLPQLLIEDAKLTEEQKHILRMISKAGNRMLDMVRLSLILYKMEQDTFVFTPEPVDLLNTFRDILADLSERVRAKKVFVRIVLQGRLALPRDSFWVMAEPTLCYSLFSNLVLNAIEASPASGVVSIFFDQDDQAHIRIHNSGVVPPNIRSKFFEKYVTSGKAQGTGLGTYSARLIATTMGGNILMETDEESGTTLTVSMASPCSTVINLEAAAVEQDETEIPECTGEAEQQHVGIEMRTGFERLALELELNSFESLARAKEIHFLFDDGSAEKQAVANIIESLVRFDFEAAKATLRHISQKLGLPQEITHAD
jgi:signal transduction histidine kinase